jgi:hypothetical protein
MKATRNLLVVATVAAALLGVYPRVAVANRFDDARKAFSQAEELYAGGKYGEAADKYQAAYRILRSPVVFFNIAQARRLQFQTEGNHENLLAARRYYQRFLKEAKPEPADRARAKENLEEVNKAAVDEAKKQFTSAEKAVRLGHFKDAIAGYSAAYDLWQQPAFLFNLAQAQRKQFSVDGELERLARAEDLIKTYRREGKGEVAPQTLDQILTEIRTQRAEYQRRREAESRSAEPEAMAEARNLYRGGDGAGALKALEQAEKQKGLKRVVLVQLYRLKGQAAALAGNADLAAGAFKHYLALEPAAEGVGLSEAAVPAFQAAQSYWKGKKPLTIEHLPPGKVPPQKPVSIPVRVASDPLHMIQTRKLYYRRQGTPKWETIELGRADDSAELPKTPLPLVGKSYKMEYYITAMDRNGAVLDTLGTPTAPLAFLVTEDAIKRPPPIYKRWWLWAGVGAVVAGSIATYAIINDDGLPDNSAIGGDVSGLEIR